jgi:hypothetical protein
MARRNASNSPLSSGSGQRLSVVLAFVFGVVFLAALLALAVAIPNPSITQYEVFRIVIAVAAGGVAAVVPGLLDVHLGKGRWFALRAGGALAVFVVIYFFSPARWIVQEPASAGHSQSNKSSTTTGPQSPIIQDNSGTATVNYWQGQGAPTQAVPPPAFEPSK